jgi:hypothetical protein
LKEALVRLKDRREGVKLRLAALNAVPESIAIGDPSLGPDRAQKPVCSMRQPAQNARKRWGCNPAWSLTVSRSRLRSR